MDSILFATPCYAGQVTAPYLRSCIHLEGELTKAGLNHDWLIGWNESLVHRARMEMARAFLASEHSHLFWLDADIEYEPKHVAALWNLETDIAVGVYAMKKPDKQWYAAWKDGALVKDLDQWKGPEPVDYAGTGFMLISRVAMERLAERLKERAEVAERLAARIRKELALSGDEAAVLETMLEATAPEYEGPDGLVPALFTTPIHKGGLNSEDFYFCRIARESGFKVIMDPSVRLKHYGQYAYGA